MMHSPTACMQSLDHGVECASLCAACYRWAKAWANVMYTSISGFRKQPMEVAGDEAAKAMAFRMLSAAGFEPLDCGSAEDAKGIEPCSAPYDRPERVRHPRHVEWNGLQHP